MGVRSVGTFFCAEARYAFVEFNAEIIKAVDDGRNAVVNFSFFIGIFNSEICYAARCFCGKLINKSSEKTADMKITGGGGSKSCYSCSFCKASFGIKLFVVIGSFIYMRKKKIILIVLF